MKQGKILLLDNNNIGKTFRVDQIYSDPIDPSVFLFTYIIYFTVKCQ